jgi:hypothetical protein
MSYRTPYNFASTGKIQDILDYTGLSSTDLNNVCNNWYKANKNRTLANGQYCTVINSKNKYNKGTTFTYDSKDKIFKSSQKLEPPAYDPSPSMDDRYIKGLVKPDEKYILERNSLGMIKFSEKSNFCITLNFSRMNDDSSS